MPSPSTATSHLLPLALLLMLGCGCGSSGAQPLQQAPISLPTVPSHLAETIPSPARNPMTLEGVELGRQLFYDPLLSANDEISCASCHRQALAFSDGLGISRAGLSGEPLLRHTPALINLAWADGWFWDGGAVDLESLAFAPLQHPDEQGQELLDLPAELEATEHYPELFAVAFEDQEISLPNLVRALAQFQRSLISADSRYDRFMLGLPDAALSPLEQRGLEAVEQHCAGCHALPFFSDFGYHNNGLDSSYADEHERLAWGRARISEDLADKGSYKTPTLRNVAVTAPYMHDGRFQTLEQVLDQYRNGVVDAASLDARLRQEDGSLGLGLGDEEVEAILAFLETLTDEHFLRDPRLGPP